MIGYICKYTPVEVFLAMGEQVERIEPEVTSFEQADTLMHPNICSFAKGVLETAMEKKYEGIILTTCCDSIRRVYDILKEKLPDTFVYILDTPRITKDAGITLYERRIREMITAYEAFSGKQFSEEAFAGILRMGAGRASEAEEQTGSREQKEIVSQMPDKGQEETAGHRWDEKQENVSEPALRVGILGARANPNIEKILTQHHVEVAFDLTCTGLKRKLLYEKDNLMNGYVRGLLGQFPCMRMEAAAGRDQLIRKYAESADGVIYHTIQFCDNYSYEYAWLKGNIHKPLLLLETDNTSQSYGQILTRMEAFLESLQQSEQKQKQSRQQRKLEKGGKQMYVLGIDSGSTSTNAVIMDDHREIRAFSVVRTGAKAGESADFILQDVLKKAGLNREDIAWMVSTGYGRVSIPFVDENVTEISCHGKGAHYFNPGIRTILDIGGQDSKAIKLDEKGEIVDFVMNDKCAAGTGRFLEAIARTLEIGIDDLGPTALQSTEEIEITSMCTVFAESEVISLIANNKEKSDIANGICRSIANKSYSLLKRVHLEPEVMMTGGVAKNPGVVRAVEEKIGSRLYICPEPEIVGAVGAALYALEKLQKA